MKSHFDTQLKLGVCLATKNQTQDILDKLAQMGFTDDFFQMDAKNDEKIKDFILNTQKHKKDVPIKFNRKIISVLVAIIVLFIISCFAVYGVNIIFNEYKTDIIQTHFGIVFDDTITYDELKLVTQETFYVPTYVPSGYTAKFCNTDIYGSSIWYENENAERFTYSQNVITSRDIYYSDLQYNYIQNVQLTFGEAMYTQNFEYKSSALIFRYNDYFFIISGYLSKDELIKIAESIQI